MGWFTESNRWKHFLLAIPCGVIGTLLFVAGLGVGMEFKDKMHGGKWDWLDLTATVLGGIVGQAIQCLIIWAIFNDYKHFGI